MSGMSKTIVWFRRDLRIEDNPALAAAAKEGSVLPIYIWCPKEEAQFYPGRGSRWWLKESLVHLDHSLKSLGASLVLMKTDSTFATLLKCIQAVGATKVVFNHLYDPVSLLRDHNIKQKLAEHGICVQSYNGDLLTEPWEVYDENGHAFTTFEAYWKKCLTMLMESVSHLPPWKLVASEGTVDSCTVEELGLEQEIEKSSNALLARGWCPGWSNADSTLTEFLDHHLISYSKNMVKLDGTSTSLLSPYLHFGELSIKNVFQCIRRKQILWAKEGNIVGEVSLNMFLKSIGLREYSRYICFNFPNSHERSLLGNLIFFPWSSNKAHFKAWRQGKTGYPLVDAGMRELWATGWMHNKIRVIVASFFVKFLLLPWTWGMKYFWDTLLDADLECDILGWQYISGSLPDGHELDRMDSPEFYGYSFDREGEYVRHWLPELARVPAEWIHHPWDAPPSLLRAAGVELGVNYPMPIVDVDSARENLTNAVSMMWTAQAASKAANENGTTEVVVDNLVDDQTKDSWIPKVVIKENVSRIASSSHDQRVPSIQNLKDSSFERKRSRYLEEVVDGESQSSKSDMNPSSTAESSSLKKRNSGDNQFYAAPVLCFSSNNKFPSSSSTRQNSHYMDRGSNMEGGHA